MTQAYLCSVGYEFDYSGGYWKFEGEPVSYNKVTCAVRTILKSLDSSESMSNKQLMYCIEDIMDKMENGQDEDDYS
jgi:hypothetical protein